MPVVQSLSDVLDAVEGLSIKDQRSVIAVIRQRLANRRRKALVARVQKSHDEYSAGKGKIMTPEEIMREITS